MPSGSIAPGDATGIADLLRDAFYRKYYDKFKKSGEIQKDPVAVDLDWDGVESVSREDGVYFDLNNDGVKEKTGWVASDDGLLVMDRNNNGEIDHGGELFGDQTKLQNGELASSGFVALKELDSDGDGYISSNDPDFDKLQVWQDHNQDGVSPFDELYSLENAGIERINLNYEQSGEGDGHGNIIDKTASFEFTDGNIGVSAEFLFSTDDIDTQNNDFSNVSDDIRSMPYLRGYGLVTDLHHAMDDDKYWNNFITELR